MIFGLSLQLEPEDGPSTSRTGASEPVVGNSNATLDRRKLNHVETLNDDSFAQSTDSVAQSMSATLPNNQDASPAQNHSTQHLKQQGVPITCDEYIPHDNANPDLSPSISASPGQNAQR